MLGALDAGLPVLDRCEDLDAPPAAIALTASFVIAIVTLGAAGFSTSADALRERRAAVFV